jgi:hypothetical protein
MRTVTLPNGTIVGQVPDNVLDSDVFKHYGFQDIEPVTSKTRIVTLPNGSLNNTAFKMKRVYL